MKNYQGRKIHPNFIRKTCMVESTWVILQFILKTEFVMTWNGLYSARAGSSVGPF
jgi:hypothetical protein